MPQEYPFLMGLYSTYEFKQFQLNFTSHENIL